MWPRRFDETPLVSVSDETVLVPVRTCTHQPGLTGACDLFKGLESLEKRWNDIFFSSLLSPATMKNAMNSFFVWVSRSDRADADADAEPMPSPEEVDRHAKATLAIFQCNDLGKKIMSGQQRNMSARWTPVFARMYADCKAAVEGNGYAGAANDSCLFWAPVVELHQNALDHAAAIAKADKQRKASDLHDHPHPPIPETTAASREEPTAPALVPAIVPAANPVTSSQENEPDPNAI